MIKHATREEWLNAAAHQRPGSKLKCPTCIALNLTEVAP